MNRTPQLSFDRRRHAARISALLAGSCLVCVAPVALTQTALAQASMQPSHSQFKVPLPMIQRSVLAGIDGRMGQIAVDPVSNRMFFAATRSGSIEALDETGIRTIQSIKDVPEPRGLGFSAELRTLVAACGDGTARLYSAAKNGELTPGKSIQLRGEASVVRIEPGGKRAFIGSGKFFTAIDLATGTAEESIDLGDRVEGIVAETKPASDKSPARIFVSIGKRGEVVALDRASGKKLATWTLKDAKGNGPMALDEERGRLFVACREPAKLLVLNSSSGEELARLDIASDADGLWFDAKPGNRIYASCGGNGGRVVMIRQVVAKPKTAGAPEKDTYAVEHSEGTAAGASTSVLIPERRRLIVTAPKLGDQPCFVYIYILPP